jgi:hypothetical protein
MVENKENLEKIKKSLISAYSSPEKQKFLNEITKTDSLNQFNDNVLNNKESIMSLVG